MDIEAIIPAFSKFFGLSIRTSTEYTRLLGSAAAEMAVTCPENGFGSASVVTVCGLPSLMRPMAVSGTPKTAFTVRVSASPKPFVAGPTSVPRSILRFSTHESKGARRSQ